MQEYKLMCQNLCLVKEGSTEKRMITKLKIFFILIKFKSLKKFYCLIPFLKMVTKFNSSPNRIDRVSKIGA
jgi:hypothetical protein